MSDFDYWEGRYDVDDYLFGTEPNAFLARSAGVIPKGAKVLAIADGEARNGVWLAEQGYRVTSQDFSPRAQNKARAMARARGVDIRFENSDIKTRTWESEAFDAVVGIFFQFLKPAERAEVFRGMARTVRPGGHVLIEGYATSQINHGTGGPKQLDQLYTEDLLQEAFGEFAEVAIADYEAEISEGSSHVGLSALIDMVARR